MLLIVLDKMPYDEKKLLEEKRRLEETKPAYEEVDSTNELHAPPYSFEFDQFLKNNKPEYSCEDYFKPGQLNCMRPSIAEGITHLKLLRSIAKMKLIVCQGLDNEQDIERAWKSFVTNAVRRFIVFVTLLKKSYPETYNSLICDVYELSFYMDQRSKNEPLESFLSTCLPPLDILMVWHAFLLNPKAAFDTFARNEFLSFLLFPFPLKMIDNAISNSDYSFKVDKAHIEKFDKLCDADGDIMDYNVYDEPFISENIEVVIRCPWCNYYLTKTNLSEVKNNNGFADGQFSVLKSPDSRCDCGFSTTITHDDLRKRELLADIFGSTIYPNIYKYKSRHMSISSRTINKKVNKVQHINNLLKPILGFASNIDISSNKNTLAYIVEQFRKVPCRAIPTHVIFREYLTMNPIHLTYLLKDTIKVTEDLVGCVLRQERFIRKMNDINWLESPWIKLSMEKAKSRYEKFFDLFKASKSSMFVPTLDIDLFWHTHQLNFYYYYKDCERTGRSFIDHNDKVDQFQIDNSFEATARLFKHTYNEEYSLCTCWYCMAATDRSKSPFKNVLRRNSSEVKEVYDLIYDGDVSISHVSIHNSIAFSSQKAKFGEIQLRSKYKSKMNNGNLPMTDPLLSGTLTFLPHIYVIPPLAPIPICEYPLYNESYCTMATFIGACGGGSFGGKDSICGGGCGGIA